jgi:two-component system, cell cycle response regulator DivK
MIFTACRSSRTPVSVVPSDAHSPDQPLNAAARRDDNKARPQRPPSVLIVDDTTDTRELYALYFRTVGVTVFTADDGRAAIDAALSHQPDVIVMDLSMPVMDGATATQRLRRDARTRTTPIAMLTGFPMHAIERGVIEAGADAFLTKPCLPEDLEQHVRRLLHAKKPGPA